MFNLHKICLICLKIKSIQMALYKKTVFTFVIAFTTGFSFAQSGVKLTYLLSDFSNIESDILSGTKVDIFNNAYMFGVFHSIGVNGKGIVFLPEAGYGIYDSKIGVNKYKLRQISFGIPLKFYPFNLEGDCGCPDFSLRNKFFEKHFFLFLNNAIFYNLKNITIGLVEISDDYFSYKVGLGAGITLPLTEAIRFEPFISYNWGFDDKWTLWGDYISKTINYTQAEFGIRVAMTFN